MDKEYKAKLQKQGYFFTGEHSAVKICEWCRKSLRDQGECYKNKFYGINSHRCVQMSTQVNFCSMDCDFCWRERNNSSAGAVDNPKDIVRKSIEGQLWLLNGFGGNDMVSRKKFSESRKPMHFAISLSGESIIYPKINQFIKELKKNHLTSFLVTNGMHPELMEKLEMPTQLYISMSAFDGKSMKSIQYPLVKDAWKRYLRSLKVMAKLKPKTRTVIRMTLAKGLNMSHPEKYIELFKVAKPDFIEVKAYMFVGHSRTKLVIENMPRHEEILEFAKNLEFDGCKIIDEHRPSRCVLLSDGSKDKMIDFSRI